MEGFLKSYGLLAALGGIALLGIYAVLDYSGVFYDIVVDVRKRPVGRLLVAYLYSTGHYKNSTRLFGRVMKAAPGRRCIGLYYDDTKTTPEAEWRYAVGTILNEDDNESVDEALVRRLQDEGCALAEFPAMEVAMVTRFPLRWLLSTVCVLFRVYPKMESRIKKDGLVAPVLIEIYEGDMVHFYRPLTNHDSYLVPEAKRA